jgi:hypothetical protein
MYCLKMTKYYISNTKHDMFRPLSEVIIMYHKDETDKKLIQISGSSAKRDPVR